MPAEKKNAAVTPSRARPPPPLLPRPARAPRRRAARPPPTADLGGGMRKFALAAALSLLSLPAALAAPDEPLVLTGLVAHPLHLSLANLKAMPPTHVTATQMSGHG